MFLLVLLWLLQPVSDVPIDQKRNLYSLAEAGSEYCPDIEMTWGALAALHYDHSDPAEQGRFAAAKRDWFGVFRKVGNRAIACELLMDKYGPGARLELFQFK